MSNPFDNHSPSLAGPARDIAPITPDDTNALSDVAVALYVETGGTVQLVTATGATRTITVPDFTIVPVGTKQVMATGTTATGIHGFLV